MKITTIMVVLLVGWGGSDGVSCRGAPAAGAGTVELALLA